MLGVLRRPQKSTDSLSLSIAGGYTEEVFVRYVRRLRVVEGTAYFLIPATFTTCEPGPAYQAVRFVAVHAWGASGTLARIPGIATGALAFSSGNGMTSTVAAVIPSGVASVTLHYAADPPASQHPVTLQAAVINNCVVFVIVPRNAAANYSMVWHNAAGKVVAH
jgi:hypothetical protein